MRSHTRYRDKTVSSVVAEEDLYHGFLVLVNYNHILPESYMPEDLAITNDMVDHASLSGLSVTKAGLAYNRTAAEKLFAMLGSAWEEDGIGNFLLQSGYRDFGYQKALHQNKIQEYRNMGYGVAEAEKAAAFWVARPRESEHNIGLAMDISSRSHPNLLLSYAQDPNGGWLAENCQRFGFIIRYQEDKSEITQIGFEPWHVRYVGYPHSVVMYENAWCLEEYLAFLADTGGYTYRDGDGAIWQVDYHPMGDGAIDVPEELPYSLSGDGEGGFVITTLLESA
jgi:D-alanyl-D-alanine carboxypeptidase